MSTLTRPAHLPLNDPDTEALSRRVVTTATHAVAMVETRNSYYTVVSRDGSRVVVCPDHVVLIAHTVGFHDDMMWVYDANGTMLLRTSTVVTTHVIEN